MPLVHITAKGAELPLCPQAQRALAAALQRTDPSAPVVIMTHGYKYSPDSAAHCPHRSLFAYQSQSRCARAVSWPQRLGLRPAERPDEPLCIGFGWPARGSIWSVYHRAAVAGRALNALIQEIARLAPGRRVTLMGHSLGARVALQALPGLPRGLVTQAIVMAAAEFRCTARRKLATPAGRGLLVLNVITRENRVFDGLMEWMLAPLSYGARSLGRGFGRKRRNWCDLAIDAPEVLLCLQAEGLPIAAPDKRVCHWSVYMRPGIFGVYRRALTDPDLGRRLAQGWKTDARGPEKLTRPAPLPVLPLDAHSPS